MLLLPTPASAAYIGARGGWEIHSNDNTCGMAMEFEGPGETILVLLKDADGEVYLTATNSNWSSKDEEKYEISFVLNGSEYSGGTSFGTSSAGRKGFISKMSAAFQKDFAAGSSLHIYLQDQRIDQLSLSGTAAALPLGDRCLSSVRARIAAEERERRRWEHLPKDPFAGGGRAPNSPPLPIGGAGRWATPNDYPSRALREERQGVVGYQVTVGKDGRVVGCQITSSSGHADLDQATCANVTRRARFEPATNSSGEVTVGSFASETTWTIPSIPSLAQIASEAGQSGVTGSDAKLRSLFDSWQRLEGDR